MNQLGDRLVTVLIPAQKIVIKTEFMDGDFDDTDDPKVAAKFVIGEEHMSDLTDELTFHIESVDPA